MKRIHLLVEVQDGITSKVNERLLELCPNVPSNIVLNGEHLMMASYTIEFPLDSSKYIMYIPENKVDTVKKSLQKDFGEVEVI